MHRSFSDNRLHHNSVLLLCTSMLRWMSLSDFSSSTISHRHFRFMSCLLYDSLLASSTRGMIASLRFIQIRYGYVNYTEHTDFCISDHLGLRQRSSRWLFGHLLAHFHASNSSLQISFSACFPENIL